MGDPSIAFGSEGFVPPLASGDYTFLIQQLGSNTNYRFDYITANAARPTWLSDKSHTDIFRQGDLDILLNYGYQFRDRVDNRNCHHHRYPAGWIDADGRQ